MTRLQGRGRRAPHETLTDHRMTSGRQFGPTGTASMALAVPLLASTGLGGFPILLVLLACPLMMFFMMRGMGSMHGGGDKEDHTGHGCEHDRTHKSEPPANRQSWLPAGFEDITKAAQVAAAAGQTARGALRAPVKPGTYTFNGRVPGHPQAGMSGTLIVDPGDCGRR